MLTMQSGHPRPGANTTRPRSSVYPCTLGAIALILSAVPIAPPLRADTPECAPSLVRAVTHFPTEVRQFAGAGIVKLGVEIDRSGRVVSAQIENSRASAELYAVAKRSAMREWLFDVSGCRAFPAHATVQVEYKRPVLHTLAGSRARSARLAAALPANADCTPNEAAAGFEDAVVVSCLIRAKRLATTKDPHRNTTAANTTVSDAQGARSEQQADDNLER